MELRREAERSKEEKNEVVLVGRFDSNQFVYKIPVVEMMCKYIRVKLRPLEFLKVNRSRNKIVEP